MASSYVFREEMRTLSRPRADGSTTDRSSARMMKLPPPTKKSNGVNRLEWRTEKGAGDLGSSEKNVPYVRFLLRASSLPT